MNSNSLESLDGTQRADVLELDCTVATPEIRMLTIENCVD